MALRSPSTEAPRRTMFGWLQTSRTEAPGTNQPLGPEELQRELQQRMYGFLIRVRLYVVPIPLLVSAVVLTMEAALWRRAVLAIVMMAMAGLSALDVALHQQGVKTWPRSLEIAAAMQITVMITTGGVASPVVPVMVMIAMITSCIAEQRRARRAVAFQIAALWIAFALDRTQLLGSLLPTAFRDPRIVKLPLFLELLLTVVTSGIVFGAAEFGGRLQLGVREVLRVATRTRDEALELRVEQVRDLTQLSAEIAHELKNPLSSIKGLSSLLARSVEGEAAEYNAVLLGEVERMQTILEGFLNFSRPLVPLSLREVDLTTLAAHSCQLHEGVAGERKVRLELTDRGVVMVRGDRRKIQQILVNLMGNAIDVSPPGGSIKIAVEVTATGAELTIDDEGPGVDPAIEGRLFQPGVTTKAHGSGLGLTIARSLARQHGGDLELVSLPGRGSRARLTLPSGSGGEAEMDAKQKVSSG